MNVGGDGVTVLIGGGVDTGGVAAPSIGQAKFADALLAELAADTFGDQYVVVVHILIARVAVGNCRGRLVAVGGGPPVGMPFVFAGGRR